MKKCSKCCLLKDETEFYGKQCYCKPCWNIYSVEQQRKHREQYAPVKRAYQQEHKDRLREIRKQWRHDNPEKAKAIWDRSHAKRRAARDAAKALIPPPADKQCYRCKVRKPFSEFNINKFKKDGLNTYCRDCSKEKQKEWNASVNKMKDYAKAWRKKNPHKVRAHKTERKILTRKLALPKWADKRAIAAIYAEANRLTKETGIQHDVDHVIPLKHKMVCGLHVENNLRVIPRKENSLKSNRWQDG